MMKNPTVATILNFIPGLGYIYVGGKRRTFGALVLASLVVSSVAAGMDPLYADMYTQTELRTVDLVYLLSLVLGVGAFMYDAYNYTNDYNKKSSKKK